MCLCACRYADPTDVRTARGDSWALAQKDNVLSKTQQPLRETPSSASFISLMYSNEYSTQTNILTEDQIKKIKAVEDQIYYDPEYALLSFLSFSGYLKQFFCGVSLGMFFYTRYQANCYLCGPDWATIVGCFSPTTCRIPKSITRFFYQSSPGIHLVRISSFPLSPVHAYV